MRVGDYLLGINGLSLIGLGLPQIAEILQNLDRIGEVGNIDGDRQTHRHTDTQTHTHTDTHTDGRTINAFNEALDGDDVHLCERGVFLVRGPADGREEGGKHGILRSIRI